MKSTIGWHVVATVVALLPAAPVVAQDYASTLDAVAAKARESRQLPGLSVAVRLDDRVVLAKGYGRADLENQVPATADTVYHIGSITRPFTAASVLKLVSQGKLRLDDDVRRLLPTFALPPNGITLRHLLTHTAGIPNYSDMIGPRERAVELTPQEVVARFADKPLEFAPGDGQRSSSSNYFLLGLIIEQVVGKAYGEHIEREVREVGLRSTLYCDRRRIIERRARGYERGSNSVANAPHMEMTAAFAAGGLCSTVGDLVNWFDALLHGRVIPPDLVHEMTTPVRVAGRAQQYGAGLAVDQLDGHVRIHHLGAVDGFAGQVVHYPERALTIAVLTNVVPAGRAARAADVEETANELARVILSARR